MPFWSHLACRFQEALGLAHCRKLNAVLEICWDRSILGIEGKLKRFGEVLGCTFETSRPMVLVVRKISRSGKREGSHPQEQTGEETQE